MVDWDLTLSYVLLEHRISGVKFHFLLPKEFLIRMNINFI